MFIWVFRLNLKHDDVLSQDNEVYNNHYKKHKKITTVVLDTL